MGSHSRSTGSLASRLALVALLPVTAVLALLVAGGNPVGPACLAAVAGGALAAMMAWDGVVSPVRALLRAASNPGTDATCRVSATAPREFQRVARSLRAAARRRAMAAEPCRMVAAE